MRIGITCYPTYGGSGVVATELGIELAARGHEVHFISYSQPFRLSGRDNGILYHEVPVSSWRWPRGWRKLLNTMNLTCCMCTTPFPIR